LSFCAKISLLCDQPLAQLRSFRKLGTLMPLLFYLALSFALFGRNVSWSEYFFGYSTDSITFVWFLNWWPFAISHGLNPFICKYVWFPTGYNLSWATSVPFLAILSWPITVLGSPVLSFNILTLADPAFAAWTAFLLGRELTRDWMAALVGGFLFGFSCPEHYLSFAQLNLDTVCLIPLAVLLCVCRVRGSLRRGPFVLLLSLVLVGQLGISTEVLATLCFLGMVTWVIFLLSTPAGERSAFWSMAVDIAISAPLVMILTAPFLYYLIKGFPDVPAQIFIPDLGSADLLNFVVPAEPIWSIRGVFNAILQQFRGFTPKNSTFIGIPLLLILAFYFYRRIGTAYVRALLLVIGIIATLSLGEKLLFNGKLTNIPMPWMLFSHVPIVRSIVPNRLLTYLSLGTAVASALWLADAKTAASRLPRFALAGAACLVLIPAKVQIVPIPLKTQNVLQLQNELKWTRWPVQPFFAPAHIREVLGRMPNVLLLPEPTIGPGMAWQLNAGLSFTQAEGYVGVRPLYERKWGDFSDVLLGRKLGVLDELLSGHLESDFDSTFAAFCAAHRVDYILIGPGTPASVISAIEGLGWPHHMDDGIEVVKAPIAAQ
jgi:hypothetical protein